MEKYAIIVAGGSGERMQSIVPKQFMLLNNKPVLYYTIQTFLNSFDDLKIILVLPEDKITSGQEIIDAYFNYDRIVITTGGRSRFHSVLNGLLHISEDSVVLVHDGVRCLVTEQLIRKSVEEAMLHGSAIPVIDSRDSVRIIIGDQNEAIERNRVKLVQTPQVFLSNILVPAFAQIDFKEKFTDEATVLESYGMKMNLIQGENENIKLTTQSDIILAEAILKTRFPED